MHYTEAVLEEISRHTPEGAIVVPRKTLSDGVLAGVSIPAGTAVVPFGWAINRDPRHFDRPDEFVPERHLDENGIFRKSNRIIFFGLGSLSP